MPPLTEQDRRAERLISLAASLRGVTSAPAPPPPTPAPHPNRKKWLLGLCLVAVLVALPFVRGIRPVDFLLRQWQVQSRMLTDEQAAAQVRQLPELGEDGIPLIVKALADSRPRVAEAARDTLQMEVQQWKELPLKQASRRAAILMDQLRSNASNVSPLVTRDVRELVGEILRWPVDHSAVNGVTLVSDCEYVLGALYRQPSADAVDAPIREANEIALADNANEPAPAQEESETNSTFTISDMDEDEPSDESSAELQVDPFATSAAATPTIAAPDDVMEPRLAAPLPQRTTLSLSPRDPKFQPLTLIDLGKQLVDPRAENVIAAAKELSHRGFREPHIKLIERLFDSEPTVRRTALEDIPRTADFDSRPWLHYLSQDPDIDVRRTAIALMATGSDPDSRRRLREIEMTEKDESILRIIQQTR